MAQAKRHYSAALPEGQAQEFEALASSLGVSFSEALRRAVTVFLAVQAPAVNPAPGPEREPEPEPTSPEAVLDHAETVRRNAPVEIYRRIHKRKPVPGKYLEVYEERDKEKKPTGLYFYQFAYRETVPPYTTRRKSCGKFQSAIKAAEARDATARAICKKWGIDDEPMNFPRVGEVNARTGKTRHE